MKVDNLTVKKFETRAEMGAVAAADITAAINALLAKKTEINMIFAAAPSQNDVLQSLVESWQGEEIPSRAYAEGGIHEAIACYEDAVFYEILAEELSRRDMEYPDITDDNYEEIIGRMDRYMEEFRQSGVDKLVLED